MFMSLTFWYPHEIVLHMWMSFSNGVAPEGELRTAALQYSYMNKCMYVYIGFKMFFYVVQHLDSIASYLPTGLHLGFFHSWPSLFLPSNFFFGLPCAVFCFSNHFSAIFGSLSSVILWTWLYHVSWFCSIYFIIVSSSPICCLIVMFLVMSFLDILEDLLRASISVASTRLNIMHLLFYYIFVQ